MQAVQSRPIRRPQKSRPKKKRINAKEDRIPSTDYIETYIFAAQPDPPPAPRPGAEPEKAWKYSAIATFVFFLLARVPLWSASRYDFNGIMTFSRADTWMALGTQPFIVVGMIAQILLAGEEITRRQEILGGLFVSTVQSFLVTTSWIATAQLLLVSYIMANAIDYLSKYGKVGLSSGLILTNASMGIVRGFASTYSTMVTFFCLLGALYLNHVRHSVKIKHMTSRVTSSTNLAVMYSGTTPLIVYYTGEEWISYLLGRQIPTFLFILPCVYALTIVWPKISKNLGTDVIARLQKEGWGLPGYRSAERMARLIQYKIDHLKLLNAYILCAMAAITLFLRPSVSCGTLLIVVQTLSEFEPKDQLRERLTPVRRLLRM